MRMRRWERLGQIPQEARGGFAGLALVALALVAAPRRFKRQLALSVRSAVQICLKDGCTVRSSMDRKLRLPNLYWRVASVVTVIALIGCEPAFDRLWTAQAQLVPPPQEDPDATRVTEYRYDLDGRLVQVDSPEGTINYGYEDATGRLARTWTDSSETAYSYDKLGRLEIVKVVKRNGGPVSEETRYTYTKVGSRETVTLPNGVVTGYQYDSLNRLTNLTHSVGGTNLLASYTYGLHATGRRTSAVEIIKTGDTQVPWITNNLFWAYDGMYRLTNETSSSNLPSGCYTNAFVYDKVGNRVKKTHIAGTSTNVTQYQYSSNDQLTNEVSTINGTSSTNSYGYDLNGSLTSKTENGSTIVYSYNLANKLSSVAANGTTNTFLYNDNGTRVRSAGSGGKTFYLVDANNHTGYAQVLEEATTQGGAPTRSYGIGDDILGQGGSDTNSVRWLLYDGHGSTRQLVASDANVSQQYNYSAYGETTGQSFTPQNLPETSLLYCGEQFDVDLQMYNLRARFYNPTTGTFNQRDTFAGNSFDPQSLHKYTYAHGDPANGTDPSGESTLIELMAVAAIITVMVSMVLTGCSKKSYTPERAGVWVPGGINAGDTQLFMNIARRNADVAQQMNSAQDLLDLLQREERKGKAIRVLTIAGHGWRRSTAGLPGNYLDPSVGNDTGLYLDGHPVRNGGSVVSDLDRLVRGGKIVFTADALIQIHACHIASEFVEALAKATKTRVVAASTSCRPVAGRGDFVWESVPGGFADLGQYNGFWMSDRGAPVQQIGQIYEQR